MCPLDEPTGKRKKNPHVQSVERALILVETLARERREMSLTEIAQMVNWPKSTVHGLLSTLRDFHYIDQSPRTGQYRLGVRFFELGNVVARSWDIRSVAKPHLRELSIALGETVQLGTENDGQVLYLDKQDSNQLIRIVSDIGYRLPMHCSGLGKVLLAYKSETEVLRIVAQHGLAPMASQTITDIGRLQAELRKIRGQGYAMDDREIMDSLRCVAAPVFVSSGQALYAISASGLYDRFQGERLERIIAMVQRTAKSISYAMGYRGEE